MAGRSRDRRKDEVAKSDGADVCADIAESTRTYRGFASMGRATRMGDVHTRVLPVEGKCGYQGCQKEFARVRCWERRTSLYQKSLGERRQQERHEDGRGRERERAGGRYTGRKANAGSIRTSRGRSPQQVGRGGYIHARVPTMCSS
jgi:hypothetical protein